MALRKSGPSARVRMVEGISRLITTIHIGDRHLGDPIGKRHNASSFSNHQNTPWVGGTKFVGLLG